MKIFSACEAIRDHISQCKSAHESVALVPTMGNLHDGHTSLIELAKTKATKVIVSIFINPTQFNQTSDYERYPRTLNDDLEKIRQLNIDAIFTPELDELYPQGTTHTPRISVPQLAESLEGQFRPGHFDGVCTVVCKLFNIIVPDVAVFGAKDYQQLLIIKRMTQDLNFNIDIICGATQREADGLAMSSRNTHLSHTQRSLAPKLFSALQQTKDQFSSNDIKTLEEKGAAMLEKYGFRVEYFSILDAENLQPITQGTDNAVVLVAAWLGSTRLIDNLLFPMP